MRLRQSTHLVSASNGGRAMLRAQAMRILCCRTCVGLVVPSFALVTTAVMAVMAVMAGVEAAEVSLAEPLARHQRVLPLLKRYCHECHAGDVTEGDVDLSSADSLAGIRSQVKVWQRVAEMVGSRQMPPPEAEQPSDAERAEIEQWLHGFLKAEARAQAGDPGRVVLRRLNNAEYTYTIRDLTGVDSLDPAKEFPADGGAGEGFTNTGQSLVMSPAMVTKYLDAAKAVAAHAVPLPTGLRFSAGDTRRDLSDEALGRVRDFYRRFTQSLTPAQAAAQTTTKQGIQMDMGREGFLQLESYLAAAVVVRDQGAANMEQVARDRGLSGKYLATLVAAFAGPTQAAAAGDAAAGSEVLLDGLRSRWKTATSADVPAMAAEVSRWQNALWKFNPAGWIARHLGRPDGPPSWMEAVTPLVPRQELRMKLAVPQGQSFLTIHLNAGDAGDGHAEDFALWENPRLVAKGRADLPLRAIRGMVAARKQFPGRIASTAAACLAAAATDDAIPADKLQGVVIQLAQKHAVDPTILAGWFAALGIGGQPPVVENPLSQQLKSVEGHECVNGWMAADQLSVVANSSDEQVRIPGTMSPHSIAVHPGSQQRVIIGWQSPVTGLLRIEGAIQMAHIGCSNGVTWALESRRGKVRQQLVSGVTNSQQANSISPADPINVRRGDLVSLSIGARDGNHSCDLTSVDLAIQCGDRTWNLAQDVASDILAGNPHADSHGNAKVWHFSSEADLPSTQWIIPAGSLLARWWSTPDARTRLAAELQQMLLQDELPQDSPEADLRRSLLSGTGPIMSTIDLATLEGVAGDEVMGIDPAVFGRHPQGAIGALVDGKDLCVKAPETIAVTIPAELAEGCELVTAITVHSGAGPEASVQAEVRTDATAIGGLSPALPVVARQDSVAWHRFTRAFEGFREIFPKALCYVRIVPVDEVVTLNLYFREDDQLKRLVLDDAQSKEIDRLWDELLFISQEPLEMIDVFEQLMGYVSQDRSDLVTSFAPMREPIAARAAAFRQRLVDAEPLQVDAVVGIAEQAYRRPLRPQEAEDLRKLYAALRREGVLHEQAISLTLARVLVAADFLYKAETPGPGLEARPVSGHELACRLSYFLWSSLPDAELLRAAAAGQLTDTKTLLVQTRRMLRDPKARRLASEFGTQWLHIHGFAQHDEKSETVFPTFAALRGAMEEESILFLTDFFQNDRSILSLLDADHTFVNEELAKHYGIGGVTGPQWRRVDGVRQNARGGILGLATTLATQAGASRTSPILRGNWLSEVILGEKLPKPPKNVPLLAETVPEGLTERQLIAMHSSDAACAKCHMRIDPFGFALENYDAIGRFRTQDAAGHTIDANARLMDGKAIDGYEGLRNYLLTDRRDTFVRQFCRKLLGYALGRSVQLSDEPLLDEIQTRLATEGYGVNRALEAIVSSRQFLEIRGQDSADTE